MDEEATSVVWLSWEDACALTSLRDLAARVRRLAPELAARPALLRQLSQLARVRAAVRETCAGLPAAARTRHVELGVTPGMRAALETLGYCARRDGAGRPICDGWGLWGRRVQTGGLAPAPDAPGWLPLRASTRGQLVSAFTGWRGGQAGGLPSSTTQELLPELWRQLYLLQEGHEPPGGRAPAPADAGLTARIGRTVEELLKAVLAAEGQSAAASAGRSFAKELVTLHAELYALWNAWLRGSPSAAAQQFRAKNSCSAVLAARPSAQCAQAVEEHQRIFTQRLTEHVGLQLLDLLNAQPPRLQQDFVDGLLKYASTTTSSDRAAIQEALQDVGRWHAYYWFEDGRYRLAGQLAHRPPDQPGHQLHLGLPLHATSSTGHALSDALSGLRRFHSHLNPERAGSVLDSHHLDLTRSPGRENLDQTAAVRLRLKELVDAPAAQQALRELSSPTLTLDVPSLRATAYGQAQLQPLTPARFRELYGELRQALGPAGLATLELFCQLPSPEATTFPRLFQDVNRPRTLGLELQHALTPLTHLVNTASAAARSHWQRSVELELQYFTPPATLTLQLDSGATFHLTMWLIFNNKVPKADVVTLRTSFKNSGHPPRSVVLTS